MEKQVVLLVTHILSPWIKAKYERIVNELDSKRYDVVLLVSANDKRNMRVPDGVNACVYDIEELGAMPYESIRETLVPGSTHFLILKYRQEHPDYAYYWFIEYDVEFTGKWSSLLDAFAEHTADFLSTHVARYGKENADWSWWHHSNDVGYPLENCIKGFNPICRYSGAALDYIDTYMQKGFSAHSEVMITTCLYNAGYKIADLGGTGEFVPDGLRERFYTEDGTMRYRPLYTKREIEDLAMLDTLFHPLKF